MVPEDNGDGGELSNRLDAYDGDRDGGLAITA
jgi:hypothetical protein